MTAHPIGSRLLRTFAVTGLTILGLATCEGGPIEPLLPPPSLVESDTLALEFDERASVVVEPITGTGQRVILEMPGAQDGDSLSARVRSAGLTLDSVVVRAVEDAGRGSVWIPRAASAHEVQLDLVWMRRGGGAKVSAFLLRPNGEPEHASRTLVPGDTVVEYFDGDGDYDVFFANAPIGSRITIWAQLDSASQPLRFSFYDKESPLTDSMTVPFAVVVDVEFTPEVGFSVYPALGTVGAPDPIEARYRVWVELVDRAPETAAAAAVSGDTIAELIDKFGDFDRFIIPATAGQEYRIFLAQDSSASTPLGARLLLPGDTPIGFTLSAADSVLDLKRSPWVQQVGAAPSVVEVYGDPHAPADQRPVGYRLLYQLRARAPEIAPPTLGLVDSVKTETLSSCADADEFTITGRPNTYVSVYVGAELHGAPGCRVRARLLLGEGEIGGVDSVRLGTDTDASRWSPLVVPATGVVRLRIEGIDAPGQPIARVQNIGYMLDIYAPDSTTEIAPTALAVGDSLVTETIDRCTDSDVFDVTGPPGAVLNFTFGFGRATTCGLALTSEYSGTGFMLAGQNPDAYRFGPVRIPPSGHVPLRVMSDRLGTRADRGAPYFVKVDTVNTAPELGSAQLVPGDTVHETFSRCGDIDTWHVPLVEGEGVWLRFNRARSSSCVMTGSLSPAPGWVTTDFELWPTDSVAPLGRYYIPPMTGMYELTISTYPSGHTDDRDLPYTTTITAAQNEVAPSVLALGDTSEIEPGQAGDLDLFVVPLVMGKEYVAATLGPVDFSGPEMDVPFQAFMEPYTRGQRHIFVSSFTGDHKFRVGLGGPPVKYRFMVHELHRAPETINDTLHAGDTTAVEYFEHLGDEDDFVATLTPGRYFRIQAIAPAGTAGGVLALLGPEVWENIYGLNQQYGWSTPRVAVPASGHVAARMLDFMMPADTMVNPSYRLRLVEIDPAPESRAALLAPADSVTDEPLGDPFDLDEYQFTVTTAGTYAVRFQAAGTCGAGDDHLRLVVRNGENVVATITSRTDAATAGTVVLASGTAYTIAVDAVDPNVGDCVMRAYRARLTLQP